MSEHENYTNQTELDDKAWVRTVWQNAGGYFVSMTVIDNIYMADKLYCHECGSKIPRVKNGLGTGYGTITVDKDKATCNVAEYYVLCYNCCGLLDTQHMIDHDRIMLYFNDADKKVTNWPGSLSFTLRATSTGEHNIARKRYDVWFRGPDAHGVPTYWWGVTYGDHTQVCHCRKIRRPKWW